MGGPEQAGDGLQDQAHPVGPQPADTESILCRHDIALTCTIFVHIERRRLGSASNQLIDIVELIFHANYSLWPIISEFGELRQNGSG